MVSGHLDASRKDGQKLDDASVLFVITFTMSLLKVDIHYAGTGLVFHDAIALRRFRRIFSSNTFVEPPRFW
jgi:hypothetical protein